jgi:predicted transcriptional regulator
MDTLVSTMIDEDYNNLRGYDNDEDDTIDWESIIAKLDELEKVYERQDKKRKLFDFYPSNSVSIADIKQFCRKCRKVFRLKDDETLLCSIDLLLMIKDMNKSGTSRADAITQGINELNEFALSDNVLFFATIQARRKSHTVKIEKLEDLNEFRLSTEVIKESGSLEERARAILALHNPKYLANKNPCSQIVRDLVDPILELTVIKNSWKENLGETIYYYIDSEHKDLIDYIPKDGEIPNSSTNIIDESSEEKDDITSRLEKELED